MPTADIPPKTQNPPFFLRIERGSRSPSGHSQTPPLFTMSKSGRQQSRQASHEQLKAKWERLKAVVAQANQEQTEIPQITLVATMGFLHNFQNHVAPLTSNAPHLTWSAESEVVLEWRMGEKQLIFYIDNQRITFLKAWGDDIYNEMEEGGVRSSQEVNVLWQWLKN